MFSKLLLLVSLFAAVVVAAPAPSNSVISAPQDPSGPSVINLNARAPDPPVIDSNLNPPPPVINLNPPPVIDLNPPVINL
ncbi:hypothetical protein BJV77DRAFT_1068243 [Russula vinacea]|nr:hypothetical protein BJV77DRAFT_1068243 [Russula vinacea]